MCTKLATAFVTIQINNLKRIKKYHVRAEASSLSLTIYIILSTVSLFFVFSVIYHYIVSNLIREINLNLNNLLTLLLGSSRLQLGVYVFLINKINQM